MAQKAFWPNYADLYAQKSAGHTVLRFWEMELLFRVEESVECLDELVGIDAVNQAGLSDGLGRGVRAVEAVHAVGHEDRSDFRIELHDGGDGHIGSDHEKTFFLKLDAYVMIHHFSCSGKMQTIGRKYG